MIFKTNAISFTNLKYLINVSIYQILNLINSKCVHFFFSQKKNLIQNTDLNPDLNIAKNQISSLKYIFKSSFEKNKTKRQKKANQIPS